MRAAQISVQIDDQIILFGFQCRQHFGNMPLDSIDLTDMRIGLYYGRERLLCKVVDFLACCSKGTHNRTCQDDISNGAEPDDEDLFQCSQFAWRRRGLVLLKGYQVNFGLFGANHAVEP